MKWNRIDLKLGMAMLALFFVLLLLLGFVINGIFTRFYTESAHKEAHDLATHVARMLEEEQQSSSDFIGTMSEFTGVDIFLLDKSGSRVTGSARDHRQYPDIWDNGTLIRGGMVEKEFYSGGKLYLLHGRPMLDGQRRFNGGVYVVSSLEDMKQSILRIRLALEFSGIGALVLAVGAIFVLSRKLSKPLLRMEAAARRMARGEFEARVPVRDNDELGSLGRAVNELAQSLQHYRDSQSEFFANISHELRTPVAYLEGYADVLAKGLITDEAERQKYFGIISQEAKRLKVIIQDLFELATMEEGRYDLHPALIDPAQLLADAGQMVELKASAKGLALRLEIGHAPFIWADPVRMQQIVLNLLDNAIRYTPNGTITLSLAAAGEHAVIVVEDTGPGIPEAELPFIFERFYRVEKSRSRELGGTGLGLSIVKKLVELSGGELAVASAPGQGSRFTLQFPAAKSQ